MSEADLAGIVRDALIVTLKLAGPVLTIGLVIGLMISMLQALTQINESTLVFIPKLLGVCVTIGLTGAFMLGTLTEFTLRLFDHMITVGHV